MSQQNYFSQTGSQNDMFFIVAIAVVSLLIRLPFFFKDVIDWDESTFILMGQSILDGHLPYTELWDLKPPLAFVAYAGFILILGKSVISIRIAGTICVILTALLVYGSGTTIANHSSAFLAAIATSMGISLLDSGQATMTEHMAIVPLTAALALFFCCKTPDLRFTFLISVLLTIAAFVRLNLAYTVVILGCYLVVRQAPKWRQVLHHGLIYSLGCLLIIFLTYFPYLMTENSQIWWTSVVIAPLQYSRDDVTSIESFRRLMTGLVNSSQHQATLGASLVIWMGGFLGIAAAFLPRNRHNSASLFQAIALTLMTFSVGLSILQSGATYQHYLIQMPPCLGLGTAILWQKLSKPRFFKPLISVVVLLALLSSLMPILTEYRIVGGRLVAGGPLQTGPSYDIAAYFRDNQAENEPIYMMTDHLVYWLIDSQPLTAITTHPSNVSRDDILEIVNGPGSSPESELAKVFAAEPKFVVKQRFVSYLLSGKMQNAKDFLNQQLANHYEKTTQIGNRFIYRRIQP
ncbi:MAG: 4-amino-4-deoxy-L-arabinose transferase and related glycosyltransferases of PMT family [Phormidium sp. OSCR]|nr:MAG: 4-amino-4-deoxy-L-arabinose transferase and related glycosyltransferases of PMT family [Phormidium sp. OSCR]